MSFYRSELSQIITKNINKKNAKLIEVSYSCMYIAHGWLPLLSYDLVNTVGIECMAAPGLMSLCLMSPGT